MQPPSSSGRRKLQKKIEMNSSYPSEVQVVSIL
uniref:Uncharacterized protein n=1 Tax=Arundo donax TaxID=35708 RepID=A0A0A9BH85_ARUDO